MAATAFVELSIILVITVLVTALTRLLRQPAIIGYIVAGVLAGPLFFNVINSTDTLSTFSHIGVALLLFFVGINLNPKVIKEVGKVAFVTGIGQVVFTSGVGFIIVYALGFDFMTSLFMAVALAFSSTIVIMKLLSDRNELDSLHGKISIGFLIVQDFIAIIILLLASSMSGGVAVASTTLGTILKGVAAMIVLFFVTQKVLPSMTHGIARNQEFLLLFSITWCFAIAALFYQIGFSLEAGALLAGIALSLSPYHLEISAKLKPIRDFFLVLFFVLLGSQMVFANVLSNIWLIVGLSIFVLIGNPIIVMILMGLLGYTKRSGFMAGLAVAQISEFSFIIISMGIMYGQVSAEVLSLITAVGLITFAGSAYMIMYASQLYGFLAPFISIFERSGKKVDEHKYHKDHPHDIIMFGYNRIGGDLLHSLRQLKKKFLVIDYNPDTINELLAQKVECRYGDANDIEMLNNLNFRDAKMVISTIPLLDTNVLIINKVREQNKDVVIAVVSHEIDDSVLLYEKGANYVIQPHMLGGKHFSTMIEKNKLEPDAFLQERIEHIEHLKKRNKKPRHKR